MLDGGGTHMGYMKVHILPVTLNPIFMLLPHKTIILGILHTVANFEQKKTLHAKKK